MYKDVCVCTTACLHAGTWAHPIPCDDAGSFVVCSVSNRKHEILLILYNTIIPFVLRRISCLQFRPVRSGRLSSACKGMVTNGGESKCKLNSWKIDYVQNRSGFIDNSTIFKATINTKIKEGHNSSILISPNYFSLLQKEHKTYQ